MAHVDYNSFEIPADVQEEYRKLLVTGRIKKWIDENSTNAEELDAALENGDISQELSTDEVERLKKILWSKYEKQDPCPSQYNFFFDGWDFQGSLFSYCKDANGKLLFDSNQIDLDTSETAINAVRNFLSATPQDGEYVSADVASVNGVPCLAVEFIYENFRLIQIVHDGTIFAFSVSLESDADTGNYIVVISTLGPD